MKSITWFGVLIPSALIVAFTVVYLLLPLREWSVVLIGIAALVSILAVAAELIALPLAIRAFYKDPTTRSIRAIFGVTAGIASLAMGGFVLASIFRANHG